MIISAGLSPAWQQVIVVDRWKAGEVNRARRAHWCASGKVINVGVAAHRMCESRGGATLTLSTLGGAAYRPIDQELSALGIARHWVECAAPTRVCTTIVDLGAATATELVENAGELAPAELIEFERVFRDAAGKATAVVLTGSLPAGVPPDFYRRLSDCVECPAVLDVRGRELLLALENRPAVVKPNRDELAETLGCPITSDDEMRAAIAELLKRGAQAVVVTSGSDYVWIGTSRGFDRILPAAVEPVTNAIGCGDCLAAGIACGLGQGIDLEEAVREGMAWAAANLKTLLPSDFDRRREALAFR